MHSVRVGLESRRERGRGSGPDSLRTGWATLCLALAAPLRLHNTQQEGIGNDIGMGNVISIGLGIFIKIGIGIDIGIGIGQIGEIDQNCQTGKTCETGVTD